MASVGRLSRCKNTAFFVCDLQTKFKSSIFKFDEIAEVCSRLVKAAKILEVPLVVTEQYPQKLGKTIPELKIDPSVTIPKMQFSMFTEEVQDYCRNEKISKAVLFGIETHVCVQQTALDLLNADMEVHVVADGVSSRSKTDRMFALERMRQQGAYVSTYESVLFEMLHTAEHPKFKEVSALIRTQPPPSDLV